MDINIKSILGCMGMAFIFCWIVLYLPFAFMTLEWSPLRWHAGIRVAFAVFYIIWALWLMVTEVDTETPGNEAN